MPDGPATHPRKRAAQTAADRVRSAILRGDVRPGSALPGERELAEHLGVSRLTLRSALARLEAEGLVQPVHGSGTRVLDFRKTGSVDLLGYLAAQAIEGGTVPVDLLADLLEVRRMLAAELLGAVAERASDADLEGLRAHVALLRTLAGDPEAFMSADLEFARLLVRASNNLALELLFNTVVRVIEQHPGLELAFRANAGQTMLVYDRLLTLLQSRDVRRTRRVARRLLVRLDRVTLSRVAELAQVMQPRPSPGPERKEQ